MTDTTDTDLAPELDTGEPIEERTVSMPGLCVLAFLIGVVAASGAVLFRFLIGAAHNLFFLGKFSWFYDANHFDGPGPWGPLVILAPVVGGLIVVWLVRTFAPEAKGHGVPEVMYAVYHNKGDVRGVVAVVKSIASAISIGSGASVGREGPIIQIGASFGSTLARALRMARWQKITLLSAGAGAGIAATFNTPLGGVLFAVELLLPEVSNRTFLPVVVATSTSTFIGRIVFGLGPAFYVPPEFIHSNASINGIELGLFTVLGLLCGLASWAFVRLLAFCEDFFPSLPGGEYVQNIAGMLLIGVLYYSFFIASGEYHTAGVGYATIQQILDSGTAYTVALFAALFIGKLIATTVSLGSGASGGVFSPALFIGASLGGLVGTLGAMIDPSGVVSVSEFAVVGMGALVGGATGASMTAIVMIFEMTRDYNVIVPLVLAVALSTGMRRALVAENIYTVKLRARGRPIPIIRHTNMYLVQQARELMSTNFLVLPIETSVSEAISLLADKPGTHVIVADGPRIAGYVRFGSVPYMADRCAEQTLGSLLATDYTVAPQTSILNAIISRMNTRKRTFAIVISRDGGGVPRAEDVVGIIDSHEIARSVIVNHYS